MPLKYINNSRILFRLRTVVTRWRLSKYIVSRQQIAILSELLLQLLDQCAPGVWDAGLNKPKFSMHYRPEIHSSIFQLHTVNRVNSEFGEFNSFN